MKGLLHVLIPVFLARIPLRILFEKSPKLLWLWTIVYLLIVLVLYLAGKKIFKSE
jgi:uncharacterized membrane protein